MNLHEDLLELADFLAQEKDRHKPRQANLRRSVSASYYALFHLLIHEATNLMLSGKERDCLRGILARVFTHRNMKQVAEDFRMRDGESKDNYTARDLPTKIKSAFKKKSGPKNLTYITKELAYVAYAFAFLYESRNEADYNTESRFTRDEAQELTGLAREAFDDWKKLKKENKIQADAFLMALLIYPQIRNNSDKFNKFKDTWRN